jgi:hypothetical protein
LIRRRILCRILDESISLSIALVALVAAGIPSAIVFWPLSLVEQEAVSTLAGVLVGVLPLSTFIFFYVWAAAERASNCGQSVGMSITKIRYVSDKTRLSNRFLYPIYRWVYIGQGKEDKWAGNDADDVSSLLLFKKFFLIFSLFSIALLVGVVLAVIRIPVLLLNELGASIEPLEIVPLLDYPIIAVGVILALSTIAGPLLVFTSERKTLADHFFGVRLNEVPNDEQLPKLNFWKWFWQQ